MTAEQPGPAAAVVSRATSGRGLLTSAGALISSRIIVAALGWGGTILVVRGLDAREWGQFSLIFTVLGMCSFVTSLGSARIVLAELTRRGSDAGRYAGSYVVLRALLGAFAYAVAVLFVVAAGYPQEVVTATAIAGTLLVVGAGGSGLDVVFQSRFHMGSVATANVLGQLGQLALTILVALTQPSLLLFVLPAIAYDAIATWWKGRRVGQLLRLRLNVDVAAWRSLLVEAAPLAAGGAFTTIAASVDLIVLSKVDTFEAVGGLAVADKFFVIVAFVPIALEGPLIALMVRYWPEQLATFYATVRRGMLIVSLCAGVILVGFVPAAAELLGLLYGQQYRDVALAAQLSVLAGCLQFYSYVVLAALVAMGRHRDFFFGNLVQLALTLVAALALVPAYGVTGAGLSRVVATVLLLAVLALFVRLRMTERVLDVGKHAQILLICTVGTGVGAVAAHRLWWPVGVALGLLLYIGLLELLKVAGPAGLRSLARDLEDEQPVTTADAGPGA